MMNLLKAEMAGHHLCEYIYIYIYYILQRFEIMRRCFIYLAGLKSKYKIYIFKNEQMLKDIFIVTN